MNFVRAAVTAGGQTLRLWMKNYRIWTIFILMVMFILDLIKGVYDLAALWGYAVTPWIFPFIDGQPYMRILIYFGIILLFCNAPFVDRNQFFVIIRSGRKNYAIGQFFAIIMMTMFYFLILGTVPVLFHFFDTRFATVWGDVLFTVAQTDALEQMGEHFFVSDRIIEHLTPLGAMGVSFLLHTLTGTMLGMLIFCCNVWFAGKKWVGTALAGLLVILDPLLRHDQPGFSPVSWGRLGYIDYLENGSWLSLKEVFVLFFLSITVLTVLSVWRFCHLEVCGGEIREKNKNS